MGLKFREYEKRENEFIEKAKIAEEYMKAFESKYANLGQELEKSQLNVSQLNTKLVEMVELQASHDKIAEEVERLKEKVIAYYDFLSYNTLLAYPSCSAQCES